MEVKDNLISHQRLVNSLAHYNLTTNGPEHLGQLKQKAEIIAAVENSVDPVMVQDNLDELVEASKTILIKEPHVLEEPPDYPDQF